MLNHTFSFSTDTATLTAFDPDTLRGRVSASGDWWIDDLHLAPEFIDSVFALASLGGDGVFKVRVTTGPLTQDESDYASDVSLPMGLKVVSGSFFVGQGEALQGMDCKSRQTHWSTRKVCFSLSTMGNIDSASMKSVGITARSGGIAPDPLVTMRRQTL